MIKKILLVLAVVVFGASIATAAQIDGLSNYNGLDTFLPVADDGVTTDNLHVYVNPGGLGDVLLNGYYNVRENKVDYFQVVNTDTTTGIIAKIRFREAATIADACGAGVDCGSREILDFVICLSAGDVWTGAITGFGTGPAVVWSLDSDTLTAPVIGGSGQPTSTQITPSINITDDQTKEGYFEILAYSTWDDVLGTCTGTALDPGLIGAVDAPNVLMGANYMIDEDTGSAFGYKSLALADFNDAVVAPSLTNEAYNITNGQDGFFLDSLTAVDYVLTRANLRSNYVIDPALGAETEIVVTFPTKLHNQLAGTPLFDNPLVSYDVWDTEEHNITPTAGFSPSFTPTNQLPHEVNVLNLYNGANSAATTIFKSDVQGDLKAANSAGDFNLGWINIDLTTGATTPTDCSLSLFTSCTRYGNAVLGDLLDTAGLPSIGIAFQELAGGASNATLPVSYTVLITDN